MKKLLKILGIFLLIVFTLFIIVLIGSFVFLKNFDVQKYKPQIIQAASQSLGRAVDFNEINLTVSLAEGIRFFVTDFIVAEDPMFGNGDFVSVQEINAGIDIIPFVVSRQISVPSILIRSPRVEIIRHADGKLNIETIGSAVQESPQEGKSKPAAPAAALPAIFIDSFKIENAQVYFTDQSIQPEMKLAVTQASLDVQRFSLIRPFIISGEAAILSPQKNLNWTGKVQLNLAASQVKIADSEVVFDLNDLPLDELRSFSVLKEIPIPQALAGKVKMNIKEADVSDKGLESGNVSIALSDGTIFAPEIVPGISVDARHLNLAVQNFSLDGSTPFKITLTGAMYQDQVNLDFTGLISLDLKTLETRLSEGQFSTDLSLWPLQKMKSEIAPLKDLPLPEQLSGKLKVTIKDAAASADGLKTVLLDAAIDDGNIFLNGIIPGVSIGVDDTDLIVKNFSLDKPFSVSLKTAFLNQFQNIAFDGMILLDLNAQSVAVKEGVSKVDLGLIPLDRVKALGLLPSGVPFPQLLAGNIAVMIDHLDVSPKGLGKMKAGLQWQNGTVQMDELVPGISFTAYNINFGVKDFSLDEAFYVTGSLGYENELPNISIDGKMKLDMETQGIQLEKTIIKTDLAKIPFDLLKTKLQPLKDVPLPEILTGQLDLTVKELTAGPKGLESVFADVVFKDGAVSMKEAAPGISFTASHINAEITDFAFNQPFGFDVRLAYLNEQPNINAKGTATLFLENQSAVIKDATVQTELSMFSLEGLKNSVASLKDVSLPDKLKGKLEIAITQAAAGPKGLTTLLLSGSLQNWEVKLKELALPVNGDVMNFKITETQFAVDTFQVVLGQGQVMAKADVTDYMTRPSFNFSSEIKGLSLAEILDQKDAPVKVEGLIFGNIRANGQAADLKSITGEGKFEVKKTKLKDFNALKTVLDKISFLPNVSARVESKLPEMYKAKLKSKDTEIRKISSSLVITQGVLDMDPIRIEADEFIFTGKCKAGFDQKYALDGFFKIPLELSAIMGEDINELKYLYDENKNISLPVHVTGQGANVPVVAVTQVALDIGKNAALNEGKKQLEKALNKALGIEGQAPASVEQNQKQETSPQEQKPTGAQIIDGIFKIIGENNW